MSGIGVFIVYRVFGQDGGLLYIGKTTNPTLRFGQHAKEREWWKEVARIEITHYDSYESMTRAESRAISDEQPPKNTVGNRRVVRGNYIKYLKRLRGNRPVPRTYREAIEAQRSLDIADRSTVYKRLGR